MKYSNAEIAGLLYLLAAFAAAVIWSLLLFVAPDPDPFARVRSLFAPPPGEVIEYFVVLATCLFGGFIMAGRLIARLRRPSRGELIAFLCIGVLMLAAAAVEVRALTVFLAIPLWWLARAAAQPVAPADGVAFGATARSALRAQRRG